MDELLIPSVAFPPLSWSPLFFSANQIIIEANETYPKQTYRNRYYILGPQGKMPLIIPVKKTKGNHSSILDIAIDYSTPWIRQHKGALISSYESSPYFLYLHDYFFALMDKKYQWLFDFNLETFTLIAKWLGYENKITQTNDFSPGTPNKIDFRYEQTKDINKQKTFPYTQVFDEKFGFTENLCILDLLFNKGMESVVYLKNQAK